jgi:glycosyltransferase involved in cell wall biosynthesis
MHIGINSRIYQNSNSGIPYYVYLLYSKLLVCDKENSYTFFQTSAKKTIGRTDVLALPNNLLGAVLFDTLLVNRLAQRNHIRIFHGASSILPIGRLHNVKYVTTIYDLAFLVLPHLYSASYKLYHKFSIARSLHKADLVVCISESTKRDVIRFFNTPEAKIVVIYPGINEVFLEEPTPHSAPNQSQYFFSVTTHPSRKNIFNVLRAMADSTELRKYVYVIAGLISTKHLEDLKQMIADLHLSDNVKLQGYVSEEDMHRLYKHAVFSIYPSFYEGFGFPVLESMICKCPVLSSNNSSLPELNPNKEWMFAASDVAAIRSSMERMVRLSAAEREQLISTNYHFAKSFTWERAAKSMINALAEL